MLGLNTWGWFLQILGDLNGYWKLESLGVFGISKVPNFVLTLLKVSLAAWLLKTSWHIWCEKFPRGFIWKQFAKYGLKSAIYENVFLNLNGIKMENF